MLDPDPGEMNADPQPCLFWRHIPHKLHFQQVVRIQGRAQVFLAPTIAKISVGADP
jgi:hypothetical protein